MRKMYNQMKKARKSGLTALDLARLRETAKREAEKMEYRATEQAFLYMLAIPLNVLVSDYWPKSAKKRAPKFIEDVISLYESVRDDVVTEQELADLLYEYAGVKVSDEWLKRKEVEQRV